MLDVANFIVVPLTEINASGQRIAEPYYQKIVEVIAGKRLMNDILLLFQLQVMSPSPDE